jgi:hypothetical protein
MHQIEKNKEYIKIIYNDDSIITKVKREEEEDIDILFNELMRMMKIIIDNTREKFKTQQKKYFDEIVETVETMKMHKSKKSTSNV